MPYKALAAQVVRTQEESKGREEPMVRTLHRW